MASTRLSTGTVSVTNNSKNVTAWVGTGGVILSDLIAPIGSPIVIDGYANFIDARPTTSTITLLLPHKGTTGTLKDAAISAMTPTEISVGTLNQRTATVLQELSSLDANGRGLFYNFAGTTGNNDPGPGKLALNSGTPSAVTEMYIDVLDANTGGRNVSSILGLWRAGTVVILRSLSTTAYYAYQITTAVTSGSGYAAFPVTFIGSDGSLGTEPIAVDWSIVGSGIQIDYVGLYSERALYNTVPAGKFFASINGAAGAGPPSVLYRKNSATSGDWSSALPFQGPESDPRVAVTVWDPGRPGASETIWKGAFGVIVNFPTNFVSASATSVGRTDTPAAAAATFSIRKNNVEFGTLTFAAGSTTGVFAGTATSFAPTDALTIVAPATRDTTLARVYINLAGTR